MFGGGKYQPLQFFNPQSVQAMMSSCDAGKSAVAKEVEPVAKAAVLANCEVASLVSKRARAYLDLPATMASCRTPYEMFEKQQAFWQQCAKDYGKAANAMSSVWSVTLPFTGFEETLEDQSLQSCPDQDLAGQRDVMSVPGERGPKTERTTPQVAQNGANATATAA